MSTLIPAARPVALLDWIARGTEVFEGAVADLEDLQLAQASRLPGWTRAHVIAHVARNADALVNLLTWARTGIETPMYASADERDAQIEAGAELPPDDLRTDLRACGLRLAEAIAALPDDAWSVRVRTARGRLVPAAEVAWMRVREVWVHAVDLDGRTTFDAIPREVCAALLDDIAGAFRTRSDVPPLTLCAVDDDRAWDLGTARRDGPAGPAVFGDTGSLAAYVSGRAVPGTLETAGGGPVPVLPRWL